MFFSHSSVYKVSNDVVRRLVKRLNSVDPTDVGATIHLVHALGNTGSRAAMKTLILHLKHDDIDVVIAIIGALRMHTGEPAVLSAFTYMLNSTDQEEVSTCLSGSNATVCYGMCNLLIRQVIE